MESLEEYVLIAQERMRVECRRRRLGGEWETEVYEAGECVQFKSLELEIAIAELYRGLSWS